jgi:hypothetical protein
MNIPRRITSPFLAVRSRWFFVYARRRKKDTTGWATINGIKASTRNSKEMMAEVRAAT